MRAIIVEDDPSMVIEYEILLDKKGISVSGVYKEPPIALAAIRHAKPDFIIMDIDLDASMNGIDIAQSIKALKIPIIFITGFPKSHFYNSALELEATSFLIKPINLLALEFQIDKICKQIENSNRYYFIKDRNNYIKLPSKDILYIKTEGNYSTFITTQKKYIVKRSLIKVLNELDSDEFIRIHRNTIINMDHLESVNFNTSTAKLNSGEELKLGSLYIKEIRTKIGDVLK